MPFKPGQSGNPLGKPKGIKNSETLRREERRVVFDKEMSKMFLKKIRAARPEYLLDQFLGKAEDKLAVTNKGEKILTPEQRKKLAELYNAIITKYS